MGILVRAGLSEVHGGGGSKSGGEEGDIVKDLV